MDGNEVVTEVQPFTVEQLNERITELVGINTKLTDDLAKVTEQLATADELLAEVDAATPDKCEYKLANTNPAKVEFVSTELRGAFAKYIVPVAIKHLSEFYQGNGANTTIGQDAMIFTAPDGSTLRASLSLNHWGPKGNAKVAKADSPELIRVTVPELQALDTAIVAAKAAKDIDVAVRLATIKSVAKLNGDRLTFDDLIIVKQIAKK